MKIYTEAEVVMRDALTKIAENGGWYAKVFAQKTLEQVDKLVAERSYIVHDSLDGDEVLDAKDAMKSYDKKTDSFREYCHDYGLDGNELVVLGVVVKQFYSRDNGEEPWDWVEYSAGEVVE